MYIFFFRCVYGREDILIHGGGTYLRGETGEAEGVGTVDELFGRVGEGIGVFAVGTGGRHNSYNSYI